MERNTLHSLSNCWVSNLVNIILIINCGVKSISEPIFGQCEKNGVILGYSITDGVLIFCRFIIYCSYSTRDLILLILYLLSDSDSERCNRSQNSYKENANYLIGIMKWMKEEEENTWRGIPLIE